MRMRLCGASFGLLLLTVACGGESDDDDGTTLPAGASCANTMASCGQTIAGALCTSANGGSCTQGACSASGSCGPPPCSALVPSSCSGETVCIGTSCETAFPRFYTITIRDVTIAQRDENGECWDAACGAPDPFVLLIVNGQTIGQTTAKQDVFSAMFGDTFDVDLVAGSELTVGVFDEDIASDDLILSCGSSSLTAADVRDRDLACPGDNSVSFSIAPR